ncbi:hypothetical protein [Sphingomicrobium sediminis]|uniref:Tetratricopeptide repeat protein n=1 Tax=Sphingomicrobium sediminis TaxID=2950949 RepID=A0A9X2EGS4_9SPHN|nr:hypothetical protein [Sphingomicrobium sediminis]MCM8557210.1 hypothetical protein [Sphingomicrobium sediminis]
MKKLLAAAFAATLTATPALAQDAGGYGNTAHKEMLAGDYEEAERELRSAALTDVGARINLAQIFAKTDREAEALILLRSVLENDDILLETVDGELISSHDVADVLMARMGAGSMMASAER